MADAPGCDIGPLAAFERAAVAEAEFFWVCATSCLKPWCPPDRWAW